MAKSGTWAPAPHGQQVYGRAQARMVAWQGRAQAWQAAPKKGNGTPGAGKMFATPPGPRGDGVPSYPRLRACCKTDWDSCGPRNFYRTTAPYFRRSPSYPWRHGCGKAVMVPDVVAQIVFSKTRFHLHCARGCAIMASWRRYAQSTRSD